MFLKTKKLDQGTTEMFISEIEKEENIWNVLSEIQKPRCEKSKFQKVS